MLQQRPIAVVTAARLVARENPAATKVTRIQWADERRQERGAGPGGPIGWTGKKHWLLSPPRCSHSSPSDAEDPLVTQQPRRHPPVSRARPGRAMGQGSTRQFRSLRADRGSFGLASRAADDAKLSADCSFEQAKSHGRVLVVVASLGRGLFGQCVCFCSLAVMRLVVGGCD